MGVFSATGKMFKAAAADGSKVVAGKLGNISEAVAKGFANGAKEAEKAVGAGYTKGINRYAKIFADDYAQSAAKWQMRANTLYDKAAGRMTPAIINGSGSDAINNVVKNIDKTARNNTIKGSLIGGIGGAGLGGLTGVVTGADDDNQKAMTVGGAIGGAVIGGFTGRVLGGRGIGKIAKAGSSEVGTALSTAANNLTSEADEAIEVARQVATSNATTSYAGISHTSNNVPLLTGTLSLPGSVAMDSGQMIVK